MAFSSTVTGRGVRGNRKWRSGTWSSANASAGSIVTGFYRITHVSVNVTTTESDGVEANTPELDYTSTAGTLAFQGCAVDDTGVWYVEGI